VKQRATADGWCRTGVFGGEVLSNRFPRGATHTRTLVSLWLALYELGCSQGVNLAIDFLFAHGAFELGKVLGQAIIPELGTRGTRPRHDSSANNLIRGFTKLKEGRLPHRFR